MANEQRRPYQPNPSDPHKGTGGGQGRESERGPINPSSDPDRDRMNRDRSRSGGGTDPHRPSTDKRQPDDRE